MADPEARRDIETRADCERLVRDFYGRAMVDPIIGYLFTDVAKLDLEQHVPRITNFWDTILLGARSYGGGAFRPHVELNFKVPLTRGHFDRWLYLWTMTVDELFAGGRAELAKSHAIRVAAAFESRLRSFDERSELAPTVLEAEFVGGLPLVHQYGRPARD
ncbi:MAG: group III truncated hemoglobin [Solirubrobacteraceae bacterium]